MHTYKSARRSLRGNKQVCIQVAREGAIFHMMLDRPQQLNAIDAPMRDALYEMFCNVRADASIEAVILHGNGKGFCAGADLTEFGEAHTVLQKRRIRLQHDVWELIRTCDKLTVAMLHGFAIGSGLELAMLCDVRIASEETMFALPEAAIGMMPAAGGTQSLPRLTNLAHTMEIAITGKRFNAQEAWQYGIVQQVVQRQALQETTVQYVEKVLAQPHWRTLQRQIRASTDG